MVEAVSAKSDAVKRFKVCYKAWLVVFTYLGQLEVLFMQGLSKYLYQKGMPRI